MCIQTYEHLYLFLFCHRYHDSGEGEGEGVGEREVEEEEEGVKDGVGGVGGGSQVPIVSYIRIAIRLLQISKRTFPNLISRVRLCHKRFHDFPWFYGAIW